VQIAPYGVATNIYPLVTKRRNATGVIALGGHDLFNASSPVANRREAAIAALTSRAVMIEGPKSLLLPTSTPCVGSACNVNPLLGILARSGSYVPTTQAGDVWSNGFTWPGVLPGQVLGPIMGVTNCSGVVMVPSTGRSYCDTNATGDGTRFWGFSTVIVMWSNLLELSRVTELGDAAGQPYKWSVSRNLESANISSGSFPWTFVSANAGPLPPFGTPGYSEGITATVNVFTSAWSFTLEKSGGWHPEWEAGIIAGVVLVSALIAVFSFLLSLERNLHLELLYSMLPRRMVAKLHTGGFAESFDHVVILFSDIVSYTDLVGTLTPVQTMSMLNDLFADFDSLVDKHGIIKVETIGDGYLCVAGAPSPSLDPEVQARAMASMALDMIEASRRHRAPDGSLLRIRVGLHAGPVMAGVVGRKMPRWCLFGDTVNTVRARVMDIAACLRADMRVISILLPQASRMESSSSAMRCQVSQQVATLLETAVAEPDTRLALQSRGRVSIKGKGELETFWLSSTREDPADSMRVPSRMDRISSGSVVEEYGASPSRSDALQMQTEGDASV
jgi:class 3 adenylate cyclase